MGWAVMSLETETVYRAIQLGPDGMAIIAGECRRGTRQRDDRTGIILGLPAGTYWVTCSYSHTDIPPVLAGPVTIVAGQDITIYPEY